MKMNNDVSAPPSTVSSGRSTHDKDNENTAKMDGSWLKRTAIIWNADAACTTTREYWDPELFDNSGISYESLIFVTAHVVKLLRQELYECVSSLANVHDEIGFPIAVAIPEGPLLPFAVLAVHVLNEPHNNGFYAILVPMDPSEAKERLLHMINDTRPALCLVCDERDAKRMEGVVNMAAGIAFDGCCSMLRPKVNIKTKIIIFREMMHQAMNGYQTMNRMTMTRIRSHCLTRDSSSLARLLWETVWELEDKQDTDVLPTPSQSNRISHIVYTSGTTGVPKGSVSSIHALRNYLAAKNKAHGICHNSMALLASSISFDPCFSDVLATLEARATLAITSRKELVENLFSVLLKLQVTHVLCTPTLWSMVHATRDNLTMLQVVALGGEPIPKRILTKWARINGVQGGPRLLATYGVTEACVYQTCGEVFQDGSDESNVGQNVGLPLEGSIVQIDKQNCTANDDEHDIGEIVLAGQQLDEFSSYLDRPELTCAKFIHDEPQCTQYRTGDLGYIHPQTNRLHVMGRIDGEDGMVKVNGVRVELGEIEAALVDNDDDEEEVVTHCLAKVHSQEHNGSKQIHAHLVLSHACLQEMKIAPGLDAAGGILCTSGPLLALLRARCIARVRPGCLPAAFVIIPRIPLSATGKCDRRKLPTLASCVALEALQQQGCKKSVPVAKYGTAGPVVAEHIIDCLNLQPCQYAILTSTASFGMLGGDSLAATRVVRALYAHHYNVVNSRHLGGSHGVLEGPFAAVHLLRADTLGDYVDWLDRHGACQKRNDDCALNERESVESNGNSTRIGDSEETNGHVDNQNASGLSALSSEKECQEDVRLYKALVEAATLGHSLVAMAILNLDVDPNLGEHGGRLSKVSHRNQRKKDFKSNPLHLSCSRGNVELTKRLLEKGCKFNSPDASGTFPLHLACSTRTQAPKDGDAQQSGTCLADEDERRTECVKLLLDAGAPLSMKDGNKQTVLHCAARSGHAKLLEFLMQTWKDAATDGTTQVSKQPQKGGWFEWSDRWFRTPVHWAVLNGNVEALRILIMNGCSADPPKPRATNNRRTSLETESPIEICIRLYGETEGIGKEMSELLRQGKT